MKKRNNSTDGIFSVLDQDKEVIEREINNITIRQQELQNFITMIESNVADLNHTIRKESSQVKPDNAKLKAYRGALTRNIELFKQLYDTYKGFEDVKFKYRKLGIDANLDYQRLINVQIRQIDEKAEKMDDNTLIQLLKALTEGLTKGGDSEVIREAENELLTEPIYSME